MAMISWSYAGETVSTEHEQSRAFDEGPKKTNNTASAPESHTPAPRAATHGSVSEMEEFRRNTCFRVHRQVCRTRQSLQSGGTGFN